MLSKDLSGRPPRPIAINSLAYSNSENYSNTNQDLNKTAPANLTASADSINYPRDNIRNTILIPPSPPTGAKTRPNYRAGWGSIDRVMSGSLRLSRASTRTSLASDDLEKYIQSANGENSENYLENSKGLHNPNIPNGLMNEKSFLSSSLIKPLPPPRLASSSTGNLNVLSQNNRNVMSTRSYDTPASSYDALSVNSIIPPPVKVFLKICNIQFFKII